MKDVTLFIGGPIDGRRMNVSRRMHVDIPGEIDGKGMMTKHTYRAHHLGNGIFVYASEELKLHQVIEALVVRYPVEFPHRK